MALRSRKQFIFAHNVVITRLLAGRGTHLSSGPSGRRGRCEAEYEIESESDCINRWGPSFGGFARNGEVVSVASLHYAPPHCSCRHVRAERCLRFHGAEPADKRQLVVRNAPLQLGCMPRSARKPPIAGSGQRTGGEIKE